MTEQQLRDAYRDEGWTVNHTFVVARRLNGWGRAKVREVLFGVMF